MTQKSLTETIKNIDKEITIDNNTGKGFITKRGLARLLGVSYGSISGRQKPSWITQMLTEQGFCLDGSNIPDVHIPIYAEYYAYHAQKTTELATQVMRAFSAIGIRKWIQDIKGYVPTEEKVTRKRKSITELKEMIESATRYVDLLEYASDKPGLDNVIEYVADEDGSKNKQLSGVITVEDVLDSFEISYSHSIKANVGMLAAIEYRNQYQSDPEKIKIVKIHKDTGKQYSYCICAYPVEFMPYLINAAEYVFKQKNLI